MLENAGFKVIYANEINEDAASTYQYNLLFNFYISALLILGLY
jgi:site-specific DNA-cytosine methylase